MAVAAPAEGRRRQSLQARENRWVPVFLAPWIIGFLVFTAGPMVASLVLSFTSYDVISSPEYVGLENYRQLVSDDQAVRSMGNTLFYTALHVPLVIVCALGLALLLQRLGRASGAFRTLFYLPSMTSLVGVDGPNWTTDPAWVKPGIVLMSLWSIGTTMVIFFAALQEVPVELQEAAELDGASGVQRFRHVTLPMISGALLFATVINTIASLQLFAEVYTMFFGQQDASVAGDAAQFYVVYLFEQAFKFLHMGYASALAWLLFLVILIITLAQLKLSKRFVYYEGQS
jgi:multiple sugar transport system permease protein